MGSFSNYIENKLLDHVFKTASFTQPTNLYIGLSSTDPLDDASGITEPSTSATGYGRINHNTWATASSRSTSNTGAVTFSEATANWLDSTAIAYFFICDHATNVTWGTNVNLIAHGSLTSPKSIAIGDNASFAEGAIVASFSAGTTSGISTYLANALLDHVFKNTAYTQPTHIYLALSTANPTDTGSGLAEPSENNYSRTQFDTWNTASGGHIDNNGVITCPQASGSWGAISHTALTDNGTRAAGNVLIYSTLGTTRNIGTNDTATYASGALDITMD
jgi:hypothetical protein